MGVDIIFFAIIAIFLIWKLMNVLNKEQSFLSKTTEGYANSGENTEQKSGVLQAIGIGSAKNKPSKESLDAILTFEKMQIEPSLHNIYASIFEENPYITPSSSCQIAKQMYEEIIQAFKTKTLASTYTIAPEMMNSLNEKLNRLKHSISLMKIDFTKVVDISISNKEATFVVEVVSQQIVYREDENGKVVEGSKSSPVTVKEFLHIVRPINNAQIATLKNITA